MKMCKKGIAWILALMLVLSMAPSVFAAEGDESGESVMQSKYRAENPEANDDGSLYMNKQFSVNNDGTGVITLESYVRGDVVTSSKPTDIVLVLDQSGSMDNTIEKVATYKEYTGKKNREYEQNKDKLYVKNGDEYVKLSVEKEWISEWIFDGYYKYTYTAENKTVTSKNRNTVPDLSTFGTVYVKQNAEQTRLNMLKESVTNFIATIRSDNANLPDGQKHRIAIVGFGSKSEYGNNTEILTLTGKNSSYDGGTVGKKYNDLQNKDYTSALVNSDEAIVDHAISALDANGATRTDLGMEMAQKILAQDTDATRNKVVVMFTDGVPTTGSEFSADVANSAITSAKSIKEKSTSVYAVGLFNETPVAGSDVDKFMNYVSSNYPGATNMNTPGQKGEGNYYRVATNATDLSDIFQSISQEVQSIALDKTSIIQDQLSQYVDADAAGKITCKVSNYDGTGFGEAAAAPESVTATIKNKTVSVTGFDFKPVIAGKEGGQKLIIEIPVNVNVEQIKNAGGEIPSNVEENAGIYHDGNKVGTFNTPKLVTLFATGGEWEYDGNAHPAKAEVKGATDYTIEYSTDGETWSTEAPSVTNVGDGLVTVYTKATKGDAVVYADPVTLKIIPRPITITVTDAEKYFGEQDPAFSGKITKGSLVADNDLGTLSYKRTNKEEAVGTYEKVLDVSYTENTNYNVAIVKGDFTIKTATVPGASLSLAGGEWIYDGDSHPATAKVNGAEGYKVQYSTNSSDWSDNAPSVRDVDEGTVTVYAKATKTGYTDLTAEKVILKIKPREITLVSGSADKTYDGTALTKNEVTVSKGNFVKNEGFTYNTTASQTNVGDTDNEFEYTLKDNTKASNYKIETELGVLTVNPAILTVKADDKTKKQGEDNPKLTGTITGFVNGETSDVLKGDVEYSTTAKKDSPVGKYPITASGNLEAQNYVVQYVDGTLTVVAKDAIIDNTDKTAKTGDDFPIGLIAGAALLALAGAGAILFARRRKTN